MVRGLISLRIVDASFFICHNYNIPFNRDLGCV